MSTGTAPPNGAAREEHLVQYVPWGAKDPIKLTANIVRKFFCADADDMSAWAYAGFCRANLLDPFKNEVYLTVMSEDDGSGTGSKRKKPQIIVAYTTFMKRAERHPEYDGFAAGLVVVETPRKDGDPAPAPLRNRLPDDLDPPLVAIAGTIVPPGYSLIGAWCHAKRKDRATVPAIIPWSEYARHRYDGGLMKNWKEKGGTMIRKTAIAHGHRESFTDELAGFLLEEEMPVVTATDVAKDAAAKAAEVTKDEDVFTVPESLQPLIDKLGWNRATTEMFFSGPNYGKSVEELSKLLEIEMRKVGIVFAEAPAAEPATSQIEEPTVAERMAEAEAAGQARLL